MKRNTGRLIERIEDIYEIYENTEFKTIYITEGESEYEVDLILYTKVSTDDVYINESFIADYDIEGIWNAYGVEAESTPLLETLIQTKVEEFDAVYHPENNYKDSELGLENE